MHSLSLPLPAVLALIIGLLPGWGAAWATAFHLPHRMLPAFTPANVDQGVASFTPRYRFRGSRPGSAAPRYAARVPAPRFMPPVYRNPAPAGRGTYRFRPLRNAGMPLATNYPDHTRRMRLQRPNRVPRSAPYYPAPGFGRYRDSMVWTPPAPHDLPGLAGYPGFGAVGHGAAVRSSRHVSRFDRGRHRALLLGPMPVMPTYPVAHHGRGFLYPGAAPFGDRFRPIRRSPSQHRTAGLGRFYGAPTQQLASRPPARYYGGAFKPFQRGPAAFAPTLRSMGQQAARHRSASSGLLPPVWRFRPLAANHRPLKPRHIPTETGGRRYNPGRVFFPQRSAYRFRPDPRIATVGGFDYDPVPAGGWNKTGVPDHRVAGTKLNWRPMDRQDRVLAAGERAAERFPGAWTQSVSIIERDNKMKMGSEGG